MEPALHQLSTYAVWQKWAKILQAQFERISEIYEIHEEGQWAARLKEFTERLKLFIDPVTHAQKLAEQNHDVKGHVNKLYVLSLVSLELMFREAIGMLPHISEDMQRLLNSPCVGNCNGRTASDVFKGPHGTEYQGIGTGRVDEEARLPWMLQQLVEKAEMGGREYFHHGLTGLGTASEVSDGDNLLRPEGFHQKRRRITATGVQ